jgi:hypothetical protein
MMFWQVGSFFHVQVMTVALRFAATVPASRFPEKANEFKG